MRQNIRKVVRFHWNSKTKRPYTSIHTNRIREREFRLKHGEKLFKPFAEIRDLTQGNGLGLPTWQPYRL